MKKNSYLFLVCFYSFLAFACSFGYPLHAQTENNMPVRSKNKVILGGKVFYIHTVQKGETVYSLSRLYNVTQKEMLSDNPEIAYGLKDGMNLKFPERTSPVGEPYFGDTTRFIFHIVSTGETIYSISNHYKVSVEAIVENNPEVQYSNLQVKQVLKIPKFATSGSGQDSIPGKHIVKRGETLFSLARKYNVGRNEIINANGGKDWPGLRVGDTLVIPGLPVAIFSPDTINSFPVKDSSLIVISKDSCNCDSIRQNSAISSIHLMLILPLKIEEGLFEPSDTLSETDEVGRKMRSTSGITNDRSVRENIWIEFYEGFLLSVSHLRDSGITIQLKVVDSGDPLKPSFILADELKNSTADLLICPLHDITSQPFIDLAASMDIPIFSPTLPNAGLTIRGKVISMVPSPLSNARILSNILKDFPKQNMILVHSGDSIGKSSVAIIKNALPPEAMIKEVIQNDTSLAVLDLSMSALDTNLVVILSDKEEYISEIVRSLRLLSINFKINLAGLSPYTRFKSIDAEDFHKLNTLSLTAYYLDPGNTSTIRFQKEFQKKFSYYPFRIHSSGYNPAMIGADIGTLSYNFFRSYGKQIFNCIEKENYSLTSGLIRFKITQDNHLAEKTHWYLMHFTKDLDLFIRPIDE